MQCAKRREHFDNFGRPENRHMIQLKEKNKFLKIVKEREEQRHEGKESSKNL